LNFNEIVNFRQFCHYVMAGRNAAAKFRLAQILCRLERHCAGFMTDFHADPGFF
jgi:hypothetical protein